MGESSKVTDQPKPASLDSECERVVRDFLDAFTLLEQSPKPLAGLSPEQSNRDTAAESPEKRETAVEDIGAPGTAGTLVPALSEAASDIAPSTSSETSNGVLADNRDIVQQFCLDAELMERLHVTPEELDALSHSSLFGSLTSKQDVLFMLRIIRGCMSSAREDTAGAVYFEMAEDIRRDSLRRLLESDSRAITARSRGRRLLVPCAAIFAAGLIVLLEMARYALLPTEMINRFRALVGG